MASIRPIRPLKRRKLAQTKGCEENTSAGFKPSTTFSPETGTPSAAKPNSSWCVSCHRALGLAGVPSAVCARCSATSCVVCSRTCNSSSRPSLHSPGRRSALTLCRDNSNASVIGAGDGNVSLSGGTARKRRKSDRENGDGRLCATTGVKSEGGEEEDIMCVDEASQPVAEAEGGVTGSQGCGRSLCRGCCSESFVGNDSTIACHDCAAQ